MHFPKDFIWGAASASYQIEGGAGEGGRGPSIWDTFSHTPGKIADGSTGDTACDSYHRYEEDLDILKELGIGHYRFSVSWPRVMPLGRPAGTERQDDPTCSGLAYYDRLIDGCLERGITPWVTLYHWDLPQALQDEGGWVNRETAEAFREYVRLVVRHFGERVSRYITINEPQIFIGHGYCNGEHAPGLRLEPEEQFAAWHHAMLAHGMAVQVIREEAPHAQVGIASCGNIAFVSNDSGPTKASDDTDRATDIGMIEIEECPAYDHTPQPLVDFTLTSHDEGSGEPHHFYSHQWFLEPAVKGSYPEDPVSPWYELSRRVPAEELELICQPLDFMGLNIYNGTQLDPANGYEPAPRYPGQPRTAFGWPVTPEVMYWGPRIMYERYGLPIVITENGVSCNDRIFLDGKVHDPDRIDFTQRYLAELERAVCDGVPVKGYFHWSILDNFEWAAGYEQRFGLVYVDYRTGERTVKDSARWYAEIVAGA